MKKPNITYYAKRFFLFFLVMLTLNFIVLLVWQNSASISSPKIFFKIGIPALLAIVMSRTTYSANWKYTLLFAAILVYLNCISFIVINIINPFGRTITLDDYRNGIANDLLLHTIIFLPIATCFALIFRKRNDYFKQEESNEVLDS